MRNPENILLSKRGPSRKTTYYTIPHTRNAQNTYSRETASRLVLFRAEEMGNRGVRTKATGFLFEVTKCSKPEYDDGYDHNENSPLN